MTSARVRRLSSFAILVGVVVLGSWLRLAHLDDMEFKRDERWTYTHATRIPAEEPWPTLGMPSGITVPNAALSVLVFVGLAHMSPPATPVDLAASVVWLNIAALVLLLAFAQTSVPATERSAWLWGTALVAVSPFAVILQRKIWAQSTLPLFSMLFLVGWWRRETRAGAALWGLLSAVLGQIHMSGLFFAAAFGLWARFAEPLRDTPRRPRWRWFAGGFAVGAIGLVVWVAALSLDAWQWLRAKPPAAAWPVTHGPQLAGILDTRVLGFWPSFWWNWFSDATGFGLNYSLGPLYGSFLASPHLSSGRATYLTLVAVVASLIIGLAAVVPWACRQAGRLRAGGIGALVRRCNETVFAEGAALGVFGLLLTATFHTIYRHYLVVAYPLPWVWLARIILSRSRGTAMLCGLWIAQLALTLSVLHFIETNHGAKDGDYGIGYRWQATERVRD